MTWYELSRRFFDFSFENYQCWVYHIALFMWIIELNNRLWWKKQFWLPTRDTMEWLGIGNKNTYYSTIKDLVSWWFIKIIQESKNQYQATIIEICCVKSEPALMTALDTALIQHWYQQWTGIDTSSVPIDKQVNKETSKQRNKETVSEEISENKKKTPKKKVYDYSSLENDPEDSFAKEAYITLKKMWWKESIPLDEFIEYIDDFLIERKISKELRDFEQWRMWWKDFRIYWANEPQVDNPNYLGRMKNSPSFKFNQKKYATK